MAVDPQIRALVRRISALEKGLLATRQPSLGNSSIEGGALQAANDNGDLTMIVGSQFDGTNTASVVTGPTPPKPVLPLLTEASGVLKVYWDGTFEGGAVAPMDFSRVLAYAEPSSTYDGPDPMNQALIIGEFNTATGAEISAALPGGVEHVVYLVTWTQAGKFGLASDASLGTPEVVVVTADIEGLAKTFEQEDEPVGASEGDLWYKPSEGNLGRRYDGATWIPLPAGPDAIADDAVLDRHVPTDEIRARGLSVNPVGGSFSNLIHDGAFEDPEFRATRLAGATCLGSPAPPGLVEFIQYNNTVPANLANPTTLSDWAAGPNTTIAIGSPFYAESPGTTKSIVVNGLGANPGEVILSATYDYAFESSRGYHFRTNWMDSDWNAPFAVYGGRVRVEWLTSTDTVLGTDYLQGDELNVAPCHGTLMSPSTAPDRVRISWIYDDTYGSAITGPVASGWLRLNSRYGIELDAVCVTENGSEASPGSWAMQINNSLAEPSGSNLITNPGAEVDTTGWTAEANTTVTRTTAQQRTGSASFSMQAAAAGQFSMIGPHIPLDSFLDCEAWLRASVPIGVEARLLIGYYDGAGNLLSTSDSSSVQPVTPIGDSSWERRSMLVSPYAGVTARVRIVGEAQAAGQVLYVDDINARPIGDIYAASVPLASKPIPVTPGEIVSSAFHWQTEDSAGSRPPVMNIVFRDSQGEPLVSVYGSGLGWRPLMAPHPGWVAIYQSAVAPKGAVSFEPHIATLHGSEFQDRVRSAAVMVSGEFDEGSGIMNMISPGQIRFSANEPDTGEHVKMFELTCAPDDLKARLEFVGDAAFQVGDFKIMSTPEDPLFENRNGVVGQVLTPFTSRTRSTGATTATSTFLPIDYATDVVTRGINKTGSTFTIEVPGVYRVNASIGFVADPVGRRAIRVLHNGVNVAQGESNPNLDTVVHAAVTRTIQCDVGDTIVIEAWQNSGGNLDIPAAAYLNFVDIAWESFA